MIMAPSGGGFVDLLDILIRAAESQKGAVIPAPYRIFFE
jgi:hypothetical protein